MMVWVWRITVIGDLKIALSEDVGEGYCGGGLGYFIGLFTTVYSYYECRKHHVSATSPPARSAIHQRFFLRWRNSLNTIYTMPQVASSLRDALCIQSISVHVKPRTKTIPISSTAAPPSSPIPTIYWILVTTYPPPIPASLPNSFLFPRFCLQTGVESTICNISYT